MQVTRQSSQSAMLGHAAAASPPQPGQGLDARDLAGLVRPASPRDMLERQFGGGTLGKVIGFFLPVITRLSSTYGQAQRATDAFHARSAHAARVDLLVRLKDLAAATTTQPAARALHERPVAIGAPDDPRSVSLNKFLADLRSQDPGTAGSFIDEQARQGVARDVVEGLAARLSQVPATPPAVRDMPAVAAEAPRPSQEPPPRLDLGRHGFLNDSLDEVLAHEHQIRQRMDPRAEPFPMPDARKATIFKTFDAEVVGLKLKPGQSFKPYLLGEQVDYKAFTNTERKAALRTQLKQELWSEKVLQDAHAATQFLSATIDACFQDPQWTQQPNFEVILGSGKARQQTLSELKHDVAQAVLRRCSMGSTTPFSIDLLVRTEMSKLFH